MTKKLYEEDAYLSSFDSTVTKCFPYKDAYAIVLKETAFFPEEAGQTADSGTLNGERVIDIQLNDGEIFHILSHPLKEGDPVHGELDFEVRFHKMQNHSGEHIVSGIVYSLFGLENVGFHLGSKDVTLDFSGELTRGQLDHVEELANEAVYRNLPITARYPSSDELATLFYRSKLSLEKNVRIVTIEGVDSCACCAPHVSRTGEIGAIKLLDFMRYKGGVRIHMQCGRAALADYRQKYEQVAEASSLMSVKQGEIADGVRALLAAQEALKGHIRELRNALVLRDVESILPAPFCCFIRSDMDLEHWRSVAIALAGKKDGIYLFFFQRDENTYSYVLASRDASVDDLSSEMHRRLNGRGGGRNGVYQGSVRATKQEIEIFIERYQAT